MSLKYKPSSEPLHTRELQPTPPTARMLDSEIVVLMDGSIYLFYRQPKTVPMGVRALSLSLARSLARSPPEAASFAPLPLARW